MPRISEPRPAAEPHSPRQKDRHNRILRAAELLGAKHGLEGMQMHDVAKEAGVAIATVYRYFPSKTHLFTAVMAAQIGRMDDSSPQIDAAEDPVDAVTLTLTRSTRYMLRTPRLAIAMIQSSNAPHAATITKAAGIDTKIQHTLFGRLDLRDPTERDRHLVRLLTRSWYGILVSALNERSTPEEAEEEIRLAATVLLATRSTAPTDDGRPRSVRPPAD